MAVAAFDEDDGQEGGWDSNGPTRVRQFKCKVTSALGAEDDLYNHRKDLQFGARHPTNSDLRVSQWQARQTARGTNRDGHYLFGLTVTYSTESNELQTSPLDLPAQVTLSTEQYEGLTCYDGKGKPMCNTAGDFIYLPKEDSRWIFDVSVNLPSVPTWLLDFNNAVNNGLVSVKGLSCAKQTLMCKNVRAGGSESANVRGRTVNFIPFSFQLHFRPETWKGRHPNVGFSEIVETEVPLEDKKTDKVVTRNGKVVMVTKKTKRRIQVGFPKEYPTEPQPLDQKGKLALLFDPDDVIQIEKLVYKEKNFGQLPLR